MLGTTKWRWCGVFLLLVQCSDEPPPAPAVDAGPDVLRPTYTIEQLKDPETCGKCHTKHYRDWSGSMHAYASDDPLFLAMNDRGQREANIGNFCVQCHAPMAALAAGPNQVVDTAMLKALPKTERGVTCYFCHNVTDVTSTHNNPLVLAGDNVMRGRFNDAVPNEAHGSAYSKLLDGEQLESSNMCGACHDIVNAKGAHIERTFAEWKETVFNAPVVGLTCAQCHVNPSQRPEVIADGPLVTGVFARTAHDHKMPAVDKAITPFPELLAQEEGIKKELNYPPVLQTGVCVAYYGADSKIVVIVDNLQAGHKWPSGAAQDRQLWFEVTAFQGGNKIFESGHIEPGHDATASTDPNLWLIRDCMFDEQGKKTHLFWETKSNDSNVLPGALTLNPLDPRYYQTHVTRAYPAASNERIPIPDRIELRAWLQPFPYEVFDELTPELKSLGYNDAEILGLRGKLEPMLVTTKVTGTPEPAVLEWTEQAARDTPGGSFSNNATLLKDVPPNVQVRCVTGTNMRLGVSTVPAPRHTTCKP